MQKIKILNKATYIILGLVMVGVIYFTYQKPKEVSPEIMLAKTEIGNLLVQNKMPLRDSIVAYGM